MRTIKFRGKRVDNGGWVYGDLLTNNPTPQILAFYGQYSVDKDTIGQYTGLLDKNGKEIYEGDMLIGIGRNRKYVVKWYQRRACFLLFNSENEENVLDMWKDDIDDKLEIIGNIHDNKDLIKGE